MPEFRASVHVEVTPCIPASLIRQITDLLGVAWTDTMSIEILPQQVRVTSLLRNDEGNAFLAGDEPATRVTITGIEAAS